MLTRLVNRREFRTRLETAFAGSRARNEYHALCYLDQLKVINDTCGHVAGDESLLHSDEPWRGWAGIG